MTGYIDDRVYLDLARTIAASSDCMRRRVGAVIVKDGTVLASAYNGTPDDCMPCSKGGCPRCQSGALSGEDYDSCICIHAEQRAIAVAAKTGSAINDACMYVTLRPCSSCLNLCINAGILDIVYNDYIEFRQGMEIACDQLLKTGGIRLRRGQC